MNVHWGDANLDHEFHSVRSLEWGVHRPSDSVQIISMIKETYKTTQGPQIH